MVGRETQSLVLGRVGGCVVFCDLDRCMFCLYSDKIVSGLVLVLIRGAHTVALSDVTFCEIVCVH